MKKIRVALGQINTVLGDFDYNLNKILDYTKEAEKLEADIIVFPELALTGYPPEDLVLKQSFIEKNTEYIKRLSQNVGNIVVIVGFIDKQEDIYNAAAIIHKGEIKGIYHKQYLPNYGVFDEKRYFQEGKKLTILQIENYKFGISICEDIWYPENPINTYSIEGCEIIFNLNASPYSEGKPRKREELLKVRSRDNLVSIVYVNLVGGQDELVFDGNSLILNPDGEILAKGKPFEEDLIVADIDLEEIFRRQLKDNRLKNLRSNYKRQENVEIINLDYNLKDEKTHIQRKLYPEISDVESNYKALVLGLRDYINKNGFKKVVLGLSGGIDSSLVATIAVDALGSENVKGVLMPSPYTSKESIEDALELSKNLNIQTFTIPITNLFEAYLKEFSEIFKDLKPDTTEENLQARIRGNILMALSNKFGWIVLSTGNKSEMSVGYSTLYGDMVGGFAVLKDVLKTKVYELCRYRNSISKVIPDRVLTKPPSAELRPNQTDEAELAPYPILDQIIKLYVEEDYPVEDIIKLGFDEKLVKKIVKLIDTNEYKRRQSPIGIKITERAFGKDRRMPITNRFREF
ncbi:MAG: NAD+ synthase [Sulfurihydrogenibium sp.]|uniref:NAD+ synthase n=1 Tax=Sulfurihydrogenibium sp. TaxID=2053621 RepID=UPI003D12A2F8